MKNRVKFKVCDTDIMDLLKKDFHLFIDVKTVTFRDCGRIQIYFVTRVLYSH